MLEQSQLAQASVDALSINQNESEMLERGAAKKAANSAKILVHLGEDKRYGVNSRSELGSAKAFMSSHSQNSLSQPSSSDITVDQKLVVRVQKGDKKAFDLLVMKYQGRVASIVSRYVSDHHEIADVVQESFIKAYRAIKNFRGDSAFYTWIYRIAINCAKNYLIAKGRRPPANDVDMEVVEHTSVGQRFKDNASPERLLNKEQLELRVRQTIAALPEDLRVALTLREFEGLSYDEISKVMDCPVGTVRSRIFRAREAVDIAIKDLVD